MTAPVVGVADTRDEYQRLFDIYWPIGVGVFLLITVLISFVVLRYRSESREFPKGRAESHWEEVYAAGIAVVAAALLFFTYRTMGDLPLDQNGDGEPAAHVSGGELVKVTAARWRWRFDYPKYGVTETGDTPTLVVPVDTPVRFEQTSLDVVHSFWIPERRFKVDAFPGRTTKFTLTFPKTGYQRKGGECNQYCGLRHSYMDFDVNVVTRAEFRKWIESKRAEEARP